MSYLYFSRQLVTGNRLNDLLAIFSEFDAFQRDFRIFLQNTCDIALRRITAKTEQEIGGEERWKKCKACDCRI